MVDAASDFHISLAFISSVDDGPVPVVGIHSIDAGKPCREFPCTFPPSSLHLISGNFDSFLWIFRISYGEFQGFAVLVSGRIFRFLDCTVDSHLIHRRGNGKKSSVVCQNCSSCRSQFLLAAFGTIVFQVRVAIPPAVLDIHDPSYHDEGHDSKERIYYSEE